MAGRPKRAKMIRDITALGGLDYIESYLGGGGTQTALAADLGVGRYLLYVWLRDTEGAADAVARARVAAALHNVEEAGRILDSTEGEERGAAVSSARARADHRRWVAGKQDREQWGEKTGVAISLNVNELHLASLQAPPPQRALPIPEAEYEVLESGASGS